MTENRAEQASGTGKRSRRRGAELDAAVFEAVRAELKAHGYSGVTREGVARRARTSKPVLYRRWPSRAEMVVAAMLDDSASLPAAPDTGNLAGDVREFLRNAARHVDALGRETMLGILSELSPVAAARLVELTSGVTSALIQKIIDRGRERGEVGPGPLPPAVLSLPLQLIRYHCFLTGHLDAATIDEIVDDLFLPLVRQKR